MSSMQNKRRLSQLDKECWVYLDFHQIGQVSPVLLAVQRGSLEDRTRQI